MNFSMPAHGWAWKSMDTEFAKEMESFMSVTSLGITLSVSEEGMPCGLSQHSKNSGSNSHRGRICRANHYHREFPEYFS
jgi:hypothetical protein